MCEQTLAPACQCIILCHDVAVHVLFLQPTLRDTDPTAINSGKCAYGSMQCTGHRAETISRNVC